MKFLTTFLFPKQRIFQNSIIFSCLLFSLYLYLGYRSPSIVVNQLLHSWDIPHLLHGYNQAFPLPEWVIFSLPEALWIMALSIASKGLYCPIFGMSISVQLVPPVVILSFELLQYLHILNGTFDYMDLIIPFLAWLLVLLVIQQPFSRELSITKPHAAAIRWYCIYGVVLLAHYMP